MVTTPQSMQGHEESKLAANWGRIPSLDGLRGLAALVVVIHHSLLLVPALAGPYFTQSPIDALGSPVWWLVHSPLHVFWSGAGPVYIFFVLSGIVLAIPVLKSKHFDWKEYYPARLIRLYAPVWAAVAFAVVTIFLIPREEIAPSSWVEARLHSLDLRVVLKDLVLVFGLGGTASPLWSLRWEIYFSLALPLFVWLAGIGRRYMRTKILLCLGSVTLGGAYGIESLLYLPMFFIGVVMAAEPGRVVALGRRIGGGRHSNLVWTALLASGVLLLNTHWFVLLASPAVFVLGSTVGPTLLGAVIVVFVVWQWAAAIRAANVLPLRWLGRVSFSLYLVHEPVLIASSYLFGHTLLWVSIPSAILIALLLAEAFYRVVERPSHRLSQWTKRTVSGMGPTAPGSEAKQDVLAQEGR